MDHIRIGLPMFSAMECSVVHVDGDHCHGKNAAITIAVGAPNSTSSITLCEYHRQELRYKIGMYGLSKNTPTESES